MKLTILLLLLSLFSVTGMAQPVQEKEPLPTIETSPDAPRRMQLDTEALGQRPLLWDPRFFGERPDRSILDGRSPIFLLGDWQSVGDMPFYPVPTYPFLYACQAELTDLRLRNEGVEGLSVPYQLFAVARFEFNNASTSVRSEQLDWQWLVVEAEAQEGFALSGPPADAFQTDGHSASLRLFQHTGGGEDAVSLMASVRLPVGDYYVTEFQETHSNRSAESLQVSVSEEAVRKNQGLREYLGLYLKVICEKKQ